MAELDDLILAALSGKDECIAKLAATTKDLEVSVLRNSAANFDVLFEEWNNAESYSTGQAASLPNLQNAMLWNPRHSVMLSLKLPKSCFPRTSPARLS